MTARSRRAALAVALASGLGLAAGPTADPVRAQTTTPASEGDTTTSSAIPGEAGAEVAPIEPVPPPPIGEDQSGSPAVFVILSLAGVAAALAIVAVTWIRTRPD